MKNQKQTIQRNLKWLAEARFGLFIHWGLYAVPAGVWKNKRYDGIGEWIMRNAQIPYEDYEKFAEKFNPTRYDAKAWVKLAKDAGMKYLVITSKHHDGFCMFDSASNPYNITSASPFGRDPLKELAKECKNQGIKLGLYYSQNQDWHAPGGAGHWQEGMDWNRHKGPDSKFKKYIESVVKPNLRELLTGYGPIALIWFDTPEGMAPKYSKELYSLVHELQPGCLVSGRIGHGQGDYGCLADNQFATTASEDLVETPATMNETWGYKTHDKDWKSAQYLTELLVEAASKGSNYLLNVGPTAKGIIPAPSVTRLKAVGDWVKKHGEAVFGTKGSPFAYDLDGIRMTQKKNKLYLHFLKWTGKPISIVGLRNKVKHASFLAGSKKAMAVSQSHEKKTDDHLVSITLPRKKPIKTIPVLALELTGKPDVAPGILQQADHSVELLAVLGKLKNRGKTFIDEGGNGANWLTNKPVLEWEFKLRQPGTYKVFVKTFIDRTRPDIFAKEHQAKVTVGKKVLKGAAGFKDVINDPKVNICHNGSALFGTVDLKEPGAIKVSLKATKVDASKRQGFTVAGVRLEPAKQINH